MQENLLVRESLQQQSSSNDALKDGSSILFVCFNCLKSKSNYFFIGCRVKDLTKVVTCQYSNRQGVYISPCFDFRSFLDVILRFINLREPGMSLRDN